MATAFISDLHLSPATPQTLAALLGFLAGEARQADGLYILGDFFEYWIGDDAAKDSTLPLYPMIQAVAEGLRALSSAGVPVFFMHGNRDFLLGDHFAQSCGMQLLADPTLITCGSLRVLLSHGDALCTADADYQQLRQQLRNPLWQQQFLAQPLRQRQQIAQQLREQSQQAGQQKEYGLMDVSSAAVDALLRQFDYPPILIHGHTHRPGQHLHQVDEHCCQRIVLADWHETALPYWL